MKQMANLENLAHRMLFLSGCLAAVAGCSFPAPERHPVPHSYILSAESLNAASSASNSSSNPSSLSRRPILLVSPPRAQAGFDTPRMVYLLRPHEISYYADNQWVDTPERMLAPILAQAMEKSDLWKSVVQLPSMVRADYRLDADDLSLEQEFLSRPSRVRLAVKLQLVELKGRNIIASRDFEIREQAPSDDPYGGVIAANRAVEKMLQQTTEWLSAIMSKPAQAEQ